MVHIIPSETPTVSGRTRERKEGRKKHIEPGITDITGTRDAPSAILSTNIPRTTFSALAYPNQEPHQGGRGGKLQLVSARSGWLLVQN